MCKGCALGKYTKTVFSNSDSRSVEVLDLIPVLPKRGSEAGAGAGSGSAGAHFSKNGRERSVSGAFLYIYIYKYIYIQKKTCRMPN